MNWMNPTAQELKELLGTPVALLLLMYAASLANAIKQIIVARQAGGDVTLGAYLKYWPETVGAVIGNTIAFAVLVLTDQLNFASALGIGYGVNSAVDLIRTGGRSDVVGTVGEPPMTMKEKKADVEKQGGYVRAAFLGLLIALAAPTFVAVTLVGCESLGFVQPKTYAERSRVTAAAATAVVVTVTNDLNAAIISSEDAQWVSNSAKELSKLLALADGAMASGDMSAAEQRLALAEGLLRELQAYLAKKEKH